MKFKQVSVAILAAALLGTSLTGCSVQSVTQSNAVSTTKETLLSEPIVQTKELLGTICDIKIYEKVDDTVFKAAFERLSQIEKEMTINNAQTSEIIEVNKQAGIKPVKISADTLKVLKRGLYYSEISGGKFDITIAPVVKLWNINTPEAAIPDGTKLKSALKLVNYKHLIIDEKAMTAMLKDKGMRIDVGGVAKGFAADEVQKVLVAKGVKHAIISLGGNILTIGDKGNGKPWKIGIQNPNDDRGAYFGIAKLINQTAVTSGIYERYFIQDGKRYHHIMDVKTGYPVNNGLASVTIITEKSFNADGMTGVLFQLGIEKGLKMAKEKGIDAIFVTTDNKVYVTPHLKTIFELTDDTFKLMN